MPAMPAWQRSAGRARHGYEHRDWPDKNRQGGWRWLTAEKTGFSTYVQQGITLAVGQTVSQNVTLQLGSTTQQVTVQENATMLNTQTATVSQVVGQRQVVDLPLNGRATQSLVFLAPGSFDSTSRYCGYNCQGGVYPASQEAAINGGGTANVTYQMDRAGHNDSYVNLNLPFPNPDAIPSQIRRRLFGVGLG